MIMASSFSSWLCTHSTKNMLLKIVHPGGHIELHDRPVLASEIMLRNPRHCVTYPHVFQQPWAVVEPKTMLMLGQKFYVVPICTVRKLQRQSLKCLSPSPTVSNNSTTCHENEEEEEEETIVVSSSTTTTCWLFTNQNEKTRNSTSKEGGYCSDDHCFMCLFTGVNLQEACSGEGWIDDSRSTSAGSTNSAGSSELKVLNRKRTKDNYGWNRRIMTRSPKRRSSFDNWQPSLESISEE